jgi:Domain of unknown function (DUF4440)
MLGAVKPWMLFAALVACGGSRSSKMDVVVLTKGGGVAETNRPVWIAGFAENGKEGALVIAGDLVVQCAGKPAWPDPQVGRPTVVAGTLTLEKRPPLPTGPNGERSAGAEGDAVILSPCTTPPEDDDGLIAAEKEIFRALASRDQAALAAIVAPEFVLRMPGTPEVDRKAFLDATAAIPGEILAVEGEGLIAHRAGDTGIVRGTQIARVKIDGKEIVDRGVFVDVFVRREGRWVMTVALSRSETPH